MSLSSEHAHLVLVWGDSELDSPELTLPKKVTTAKKGPLSLNTGTEHLGTGRRRLTYPSHTHLALTPDRSNSLPLSSILRQRRRSSVTKYPVEMLERPIELVEKELGTLSCAQLKDSLQVTSYDLEIQSEPRAIDFQLNYCGCMTNQFVLVRLSLVACPGNTIENESYRHYLANTPNHNLYN